jgi:serine/threonine protein kinase
MSRLQILSDLFPIEEPLHHIVQVTEEVIGTGSQAFVKIGKLKTMKKVALKYFDRALLETDPMFTERLASEIRALSSTHHPNIIGFYGFVIEEKHVVLIMEYASNGDLLDALNSFPVSETQAASWFIDMLRAIEYLHLLKIVHRDLKPENFLIDDNGTIKLADFGYCRALAPNQRLKTPCGSMTYAAPEIFETKTPDDPGYTETVDIWALGICLYTMVNKINPWGKVSDRDMPRIIAARKIVPFSPNVSENCKDLFFKMCNLDAAERISAHKALFHPWAKKFTLPLLHPKRRVLGEEHRSKNSSESSLDAAKVHPSFSNLNKFRSLKTCYSSSSTSTDLSHSQKDICERSSKDLPPIVHVNCKSLSPPLSPPPSQRSPKSPLNPRRFGEERNTSPVSLSQKYPELI